MNLSKPHGWFGRLRFAIWLRVYKFQHRANVGKPGYRNGGGVDMSELVKSLAQAKDGIAQARPPTVG